MSKRKVPITSLEAFHSLDPDKIGVLHKKIINALSVIQVGTYEKIAKQAKIKDVQCWKRISETIHDGLVERTGKRVKLISGREGFEYRLTEKGRNFITESALPGKTVSDFSKDILQEKNPVGRPKKLPIPLPSQPLF